MKEGDIKLKFFDASLYVKERKSKKSMTIEQEARFYKDAFEKACIELVIEGNFDTVQKARNEMIKRAKKGKNNLK